MRPHHLLWFLLLLTTSCADSGHTSTVLKNTSTSRLTITCTAKTVAGDWKGLKLDDLRAVQEALHADTCFLTEPEGKLVMVRTLEAGDSLVLGQGREAFLRRFTTPPLDWEAVTARPAAGQPVTLTPASITQFVTGTYRERERCGSECERITRVFKVELPATPSAEHVQN
ncbi:hypothetical protein [Hymenobacter sp. HDW8]|uniref:hypothetical protein n=1 Tax=Hymenobacter sp. HDW8 TaxID=2714932 RepID=UPI0014099680|nr:hypothetical protein [Hymenobacter sp. HDW8]QIL78449.1 hypothetical protein G7064_21755 [Hymenobacter sp. HDW8]